MPLKLSLAKAPDVPLEADAISPGGLAGLSAAKAARLPVLAGNRLARVGDFFRVSGKGDGDVRLEGDLKRVKLIGAGMSAGRIFIEGDAGMHLGTGLSGGEITVEGDAGDWVGAEMSGGRIIVKGRAGHMVGSAYRGGQAGMLGGEIIVHGDAGNEAGNTMRNGLIAIGGDSGDFTGVNMRSGTIVVLGRLGGRSGAGMRRGSIVAMEEAELLPTFTYSCTYRPLFLGLYLAYLRRLGMAVGPARVHGRYRRWCGDSIELNRGEVLLFDG